MKLRQVGEDRLLARLFPTFAKGRGIVTGVGDDVAVVKSPGAGNLLLLKTDCVVEGVHFDSTAAPESIGWKAMMRPLSDFAAVAGVPEFALTTLVVSKETESAWVEKMYRGLKRAAARFHVSIVGGETSSTRGPTVISVSVSGFAERGRWISRTGGKSGDRLFVTGRLGGSRKQKHLRFVPRIEESRWLSQTFRIHAMIDLSDGLGSDLPRLARASNVGFEIEVRSLPRSSGATIRNAISDGEDYELLFAISPGESTRLQRAWKKKFPKVPLTCIGRLVSRPAVRARPGRVRSKLNGGYVHFQ